MTAALLIARKIFGAVPWWVWLIVVAVAWGGWQRHQAKSAAEKYTKAVTEAAAARETALVADAQETARRLQVQKGITDAAQQKAKALAADVDRARNAEQRLLDKLAAIKADAGAANPTAPGGGQATETTTGMLADMLGKCVRRYRGLAEYADAARDAGQACEASYEALTAKPFRAP